MTFRNKLGDHRREPIVVTSVPKEFEEELKAEQQSILNSQQSTKDKEEQA